MKRLVLPMLIAIPATLAFADVIGQVHPFTSPGGVTERCVQVDPIPGVTLNKKDLESEADLCNINVYSEDVAMCPKEKSTSPGTYIYSTQIPNGAKLTQAQFEATRCSPSLADANKKLAKFKNTMNSKDTSGTYSQASLLYYQLSRYFDTDVDVAVSVYRSIDKNEHYKRVSVHAPGVGGMNIAGWGVERAAEQNPNTYTPVRDLFTPDLKQIYGVLIVGHSGTRYGAEINGIRSSWGIGQNNDFQATPAYTALRTDAPFAQAVTTGLGAAHANARMAGDVGTLPISSVQMGIWMKQLTEITLLDYMFNQQDRIGNINYDWAWAYMNNGHWDFEKEKRDEYKDLARNKMSPGLTPPDDIAQFKPFLVQTSKIYDNDAGGNPRYANFTARTTMLEKIRHYDLATYRKLIKLNIDLQRKGPIFQHLRDKLNITDHDLAMVVANTGKAAGILTASCRSGHLHFDLNLDRIVAGQPSEDKVADCTNP